MAVETTFPPQAPFFDREQGGWILTRYADVTAALREPRLWPVATRGEELSKTRDEVGRLRLRPDVQETLSAARLSAWQSQMEEPTRQAVRELPTGRPVDLLQEFAKPWCLRLAMLVTGASPHDRERLSKLGNAVFAGTGAPEGSVLKTEAAAATGELDQVFQQLAVPMGEPTFIAISQTSARLLSNAWLALFTHPAEYARLRAHRELMPNAIEELLRFAGIVRRVFRWAIEDLDLGGVRIAKGDRVLLMLASANHDPEQFPAPDHLDVTRRLSPHIALGMGRNSCVGAPLIRMAATIATHALLDRFSEADVALPIEWHLGSGFRFPAAVPVTFRE
ncbi:MAG TPA: cytochrome P450 [Bryobacteraceae bacterium]|nr:cytochrome P450 [Bryobacteraceae bacterium]